MRHELDAYYAVTVRFFSLELPWDTYLSIYKDNLLAFSGKRSQKATKILHIINDIPDPDGKGENLREGIWLTTKLEKPPISRRRLSTIHSVDIYFVKVAL
jgi:hypothetical protein